MLVLKCIYPKSVFAKCTRLACLLSFASLSIYEVLLNQLHEWMETLYIDLYIEEKKGSMKNDFF